MTHIDLFSGIAGFAIAAQENGFETIGFSEIEPYCCKLLKQHYPNITNYGDIRNVPAIYADIITGGPPCQPASIAGKRLGAADHRWLWEEAIAVVERCQPAMCLFENPAGILTLNNGVEFERVLSSLESLGYSVQPIVVPACAVDARHRRDRVWIMGRNSDAMRCGRNGWSKRAFQNENSDTDGICKDVANTRHLCGRNLAESNGSSHATPSGCCENVQHAECAGLEGIKTVASDCKGAHKSKSFKTTTTATLGGTSRIARWPVESAICRVVNGVPNRSHRLKGLGNAIVPQVASILIREMVKAFNSSTCSLKN